MGPVLRPPAAKPADTLPKMFRLWVIALLLPSLALARVLPSSHLNRLRGERVKESAFAPESIDSNEIQEINGIMDFNDSFESDESSEYSSIESIESGEGESTTMMPISPPEEMLPISPPEQDQEMRFRYALSQVLLPPPEPIEQPGSSKLNLPPAVQREQASMLLHGETSFQPYANLVEKDELEEDFEKLEDLDDFEDLEDLEGSIDELPELAAWKRYRGPNKLDVDGEENLEDYEDYQDEKDEDDLENAREIVEDKWLSEEEEEEDEGDEGEWQEEEEEDEDEEEEEEEEDEEEKEEEEEDDLEQDEEEEWLPELSAGEKYRGPSIMVDLVEGQVPK